MTDAQGQGGPSGTELLARSRAELETVEGAIRAHPFLGRLEAREVPDERLRAFAAAQYRIVSSDRRSFAQLAARFPGGPPGEFFLSMAEGEGEALRRLASFVAWLGLDQKAVRELPAIAGAQAYPAFVAWLAINGGRADVALAFLANLAAWGENCGRVAAALRSAYGADDAAAGFFDFFASSPPGFEDRALAVIEVGLAEGESADEALQATRLLQAYELSFWDAMAEDEP